MPPSLLTMVQVTVAVKVMLAPAVSTVPDGGEIEFSSIQSVSGEVGEFAPHADTATRATTGNQLRRTTGHPWMAFNLEYTAPRAR